MKASQRRFGGYGIRRSPRITGGAPVDLRLLRFGDGTFTRAAEGSYQTGANSLAWAPSDTLRYEDRGDGNGPVPLFEGVSRNLIVAPEDLTDAAWFTPAQVITADALTAPDGESDADYSEITVLADRGVEQLIPTTINTTYTASFWTRAVAPSVPEVFSRLQDRAGSATSGSVLVPTEAWQHLDQTINVGSDAADLASIECRTFGMDAIGQRFGAWGFQWEALPFPTSYMRLGTSTDRAPDVLTFASGQVPAAMHSGKWAFDCYPGFDTDDTANATFYYLYSFESGAGVDGILFQENTARIRVICGGTTTTIAGLSADRHQKLTFEVDAAAQEITLSGFTTGNGTYSFTGSGWTGGVRVGARWSYTSPFYGRISEPRAW